MQALSRTAQLAFVAFEVEEAYLYDELAVIPDGRDRMIALVSRKMDAPLITFDAAIIRSGAITIAE